MAKTTFNTAAVTIGGLYLATHSVAVTPVGTLAATVLTCWALWLSRDQDQALNRGEPPVAGPGWLSSIVSASMRGYLPCRTRRPARLHHSGSYPASCQKQPIIHD